MTPPITPPTTPPTVACRDTGMTTAEYAVGTLGACTIAVVLHQLATDGFWFDQLVEIFTRALAWRNIPGGVPLPRIRLP